MIYRLPTTTVTLGLHAGPMAWWTVDLQLWKKIFITSDDSDGLVYNGEASPPSYRIPLASPQFGLLFARIDIISISNRLFPKAKRKVKPSRLSFFMFCYPRSRRLCLAAAAGKLESAWMRWSGYPSCSLIYWPFDSGQPCVTGKWEACPMVFAYIPISRSIRDVRLLTPLLCPPNCVHARPIRFRRLRDVIREQKDQRTDSILICINKSPSLHQEQQQTNWQRSHSPTSTPGGVCSYTARVWWAGRLMDRPFLIWGAAPVRSHSKLCDACGWMARRWRISSTFHSVPICNRSPSAASVIRYRRRFAIFPQKRPSKETWIPVRRYISLPE